MAYDPNSRFKRVESAQLAPGESALTRTTVGPFVDTGVSLNGPDAPLWRGRVYIAVGEVREMAEQLDLFADYEERIRTMLEEIESVATAAYNDGYDAARAEQINEFADELVDRMRSRLGLGPEPDRVAPGGAEAAGDDPAAEPAPVDQPAAAGGEGRDDLPGAQPDAAGA